MRARLRLVDLVGYGLQTGGHLHEILPDRVLGRSASRRQCTASSRRTLLRSVIVLLVVIVPSGNFSLVNVVTLKHRCNRPTRPSSGLTVQESICIGETGFLGPETERPKSPYGRGPLHQTLGDCLQANSRECWFRMGSTEEAASVAGRPAG